MVKLRGPADQPGRAVGERGSVRSHHQWGARFGRRRDEMSQRSEPGTLLELEELATRSAKLMEKYNPKSENNFNKAMELLRLQYNLVSYLSIKVSL